MSLFLSGCAVSPESSQQTIFAMDTVMSISVYGGNSDKYTAEAVAEINRLAAMWSVTDEESEIYRLNNSGGKPVEVSSETAELISFALEMGGKTEGTLDITLYPVLCEWGFTSGEYRIPTDERLGELLKQRAVPKIDGNNITVPDGTEIDLGAVAKGYTGDIISAMLKERGVTSALLDLGGNIHAVGSRPDGSDWRLGIKDPFGEGSIGILDISGKAAVTSGNYERFFTGEDGKRYCHILDPKTGRPVENGLSSVTIVGDEGRLCDALSTALFVMGEENATYYWQQNGGFEMILISDDGDILYTEGLQGSFSPTDSFNGELTLLRR